MTIRSRRGNGVEQYLITIPLSSFLPRDLFSLVYIFLGETTGKCFFQFIKKKKKWEISILSLYPIMGQLRE